MNCKKKDTYLGGASGDIIHLRGNAFNWTTFSGYTGGVINYSGTGNVCTGKEEASCKLDVEGVVKANQFTVASDARFKDNINDLTTDISKIKMLRPVRHNMKPMEKILPNIKYADDTQLP